MNDEPIKLTVSGLVALLGEVVESNFVAVRVEGEISNFARPASGHWYFTLKDDRAQLRAVMFRGRNRLADIRPEDGLQVVCHGSVGVYAARGEVQLVVERLEGAGLGDLQQAFEELKARLAAEGLFAADRKRPLPEFPRCIGIVTSPTGAAIQDILNVVRRRAPGLRILLRPVRVQGPGAAEEIATAIAELQQQGEADVLIVGRGGGSLEDLWAFNEERVARAIVASTIPVVSAVGHEVDLTIADLAADLRAPTPSAAAELVAKGRLELENHLDHLIMRLESQLRQRLALVSQNLHNLQQRLHQSVRGWALQQEHLDQLQHRLTMALQGELRRQRDRLGTLAGRLQDLSPLQQLERGYLLASRRRDAERVRRAGEVEPDQDLWLRFADGRVKTRVTRVER